MTPAERQTLVNYVRRCRLATVSSLAADGAPQAALVGIAITEALEIIFDTDRTSRKHANLAADPRAAVTVSGPGEQTLQYEGRAHPVSIHDQNDALYLETYYSAWPDGRDRLSWPNIAYWRITPTWIRYSDFDLGPLILEFALSNEGLPSDP
jgi:pyridoxine/pyridoxamine 5'-phosphate oxidase